MLLKNILRAQNEMDFIDYNQQSELYLEVYGRQLIVMENALCQKVLLLGKQRHSSVNGKYLEHH